MSDSERITIDTSKWSGAKKRNPIVQFFKNLKNKYYGRLTKSNLQRMRITHSSLEQMMYRVFQQYLKLSYDDSVRFDHIEIDGPIVMVVLDCGYMQCEFRKYNVRLEHCISVENVIANIKESY